MLLQQNNTERRLDRNIGIITTGDLVPDDVFIVGAAVIVMDEEGQYRAVFVPDALDNVPDPDVQEVVGPIVAQAFAAANFNINPEED